MTTFQTTRHLEIDENHQGINLTEFVFKADGQADNDRIVDRFIRSKEFSLDSLRDCIKAEPDKGYLRNAFNIDRVHITDFKKTDKKGASKFLIDFLNEPDWGDDRDDFAKLLDRYFEIHNKFGEHDYYIISQNWFDKDNEKVVQHERWIYTYYFLIISVDRSSNLLTLSEWTYD